MRLLAPQKKWSEPSTPQPITRTLAFSIPAKDHKAEVRTRRLLREQSLTRNFAPMSRTATGLPSYAPKLPCEVRAGWVRFVKKVGVRPKHKWARTSHLASRTSLANCRAGSLSKKVELRSQPRLTRVIRGTKSSLSRSNNPSLLFQPPTLPPRECGRARLRNASSHLVRPWGQPSLQA